MPLDPNRLRERIEAGATTAEIAAETGWSRSGIQSAMHRNGIPTPAEVRRAQIDHKGILRAWKRGDHVEQIAEVHGRTVAWVRMRVRNVQRTVQKPRRARQSRFAELNDPDWLRAQLASGRSIASIAREVGSDRHNVRYMLRRHGILPQPDS